MSTADAGRGAGGAGAGRTAGSTADAALAYERTHLAWSRMSLLMMAMGALIPRFLWSSLGWFSLAAGAVALALAGTILAASRRRHRRVHPPSPADARTASRGTSPADSRAADARPADGLLPALTTVTAVVLCAAALLALV